MSSSNLVRLAVIEETTLGVTPGAGNFKEARFTSESLSGTPETTKSQTIRSDRMSSGQIVTGLTVEGSLNFELAKDTLTDDLLESAMMNSWDVQALVTVDLTINATAKTITRASGSFTGNIVVGDIISLSGFSTSVNNTLCQVLEVVSATVIRCVFENEVVDETGTGTAYKRADKLTIGQTKKSFSIEKAFLDLANKATIYKGMLVNTMNLNVAYGEVISGVFNFNGTKRDEADTAVEFITNGRTILDADTTQPLNGSIDMPFISTNVLGTMEEAPFCTQSLSIDLNNNLLAQKCIGEAAPKDYSPGEAAIEIKMNSYLSDINWPVIAKKLTQAPFAMAFAVKNGDGFYGFYLPAIQVSFPDPSSGGANQDISLDMSGTAKVGSSGESALVIYRS